jgi:hypothetical protein
MTEKIYTGENIGHRIISKYFQFTITNPKTPIETDFQTNDRVYVSNKGFVDGYKFTEYADFNEDATKTNKDGEQIDIPKETYIDKAAGYIRWNTMCLNLSRFGVFFMELNELASATSIVEPTKVDFTFGYEQPESIIEFVDDSFDGDAKVETLRDGRKIIKGADALKEIIAKTLSSDVTSYGMVYDPTKSDFKKDGMARGDGSVRRGFYDKMIRATKVFADVKTARNNINITEYNRPDGSKEVITGVK